MAFTSQHTISVSIALFIWTAVLPGADLTSRPAGPVYVPLDSWVYPVLRRLASMGYAPDAESLVMPWTRQQCSMLTAEAAEIASRRSSRVEAAGTNQEALRMLTSLETEFRRESEIRTGVRIDSLYSRSSDISGRPLTDGFHFGQTIMDDYGRPYAEGGNSSEGFSGYGLLGRFSGYLRGEYQQAASVAPESLTVRNAVANLDHIPVQPLATGGVSRFNLLEFYVGAELGKFDVTVGKQSLWWGPDESSAYQFSNNSEPLYSVRISQRTPILLPRPLRILGRVRTQFVLARLTGHHYPSAPFLNAQKITLQVTPDLEFGFTRSAVFGGTGHPLTTGSFFRSIFSVSSTPSSSFGASDAGDRRSGFDFRWYLPRLRRHVSIYSDALSDDDPSPLAAPHRAAWAPGINFTQLPGMRHLDLSVETFSTWLYRKDEGGQFIYWNDEYHDGYTNNGNVIGSWIGRDARAYVVSSRYWWSAQNTLTASLLHKKTSAKFLPEGGMQTDASVNAQWKLGSQLLANAYVQFERYYVPLLGQPRADVVAGLQLTFYPRNWMVSGR